MGEEEEMEMDDDMWMSEQFVVKQASMEKEKEKLAVKVKEEANVNQYIFDIVLARMVEIARRFCAQIDDDTWSTLQKQVFVGLEGETEQHGRIRDSVQSIEQIRRLNL